MFYQWLRQQEHYWKQKKLSGCFDTKRASWEAVLIFISLSAPCLPAQTLATFAWQR